MVLILTPRRLARLTVLVGIATMTLALVGFWAVSQGLGWPELLFRSAALLALEPHGETANRWLDAASLGALLFSLLAVGTVIVSLSASAFTWVIGFRSRLRPRQGHAVIVGLGRVGLQLLRDLRPGRGRNREGARPARRHVIVLEPDPDNPNIEEARRLGGLVLTGDARAEALRRKARLHLARELFIACGDDALNLDLASEVVADFRRGAARRSRGHRKQVEQRFRHLQCHVHTTEPAFADLVVSRDLLLTDGAAVDLHLFSALDNAARELLLADSIGLARHRYAPAADEVAQYFLFGFGATGQTVALHMARLAHFANRRRLRLTVLDRFGGGSRESLLLRAFRDRHPAFAPGPGFDLEPLVSGKSDADRWACRDFRPEAAGWRSDDPGVVEYAANAEFLDLSSEIDAPELLERLARRFRPPGGPPVRPAVVLCFDEDRRNFQAALRLGDAIRHLGAGHAPERPVPIYACLPNETGLASLLLQRGTEDDPCPVHVFGELETSGSYRRVVRPVITDLAGFLHEAYERLEREPGEGRFRAEGGPELELSQVLPSQELRGDGSALYGRVPARFRASNEAAAAHVDVKLDAIGFRRRPAHPGETPATVRLSPPDMELLAQVEHNRWMAERLTAGWRFGPRDDLRKRRPAFRPWEQLPDADERKKDRSQIEALVTALNAAGQVVEPDPGTEGAAISERLSTLHPDP